MKNVSLTEIFSYDLVTEPGFKTSTMIVISEARNKIRKRKINKILKNPLD